MDIEKVNADFDLLIVAEGDTQLKRVGGWFIGPCPFCGGVDRFNLQRTRDGWRWFCRGCGDGKYHSSVDYMVRRDSVSIHEAIQTMSGEYSQATWKERAQKQPAIVHELRQPNEVWRQRGREFVETCRQNLWKPVGEKALGYLRSRGFTDHTLVKYHIGFNPTDRTETLDLWGLESDRSGDRINLLRGITLPASGPGGLYYIKIRRAVAAGSKEKKYVKVRGSKPGIFGYNNLRGSWLVVVTEGEMDCMILDQAAGDTAGVCTFGSATDSPLNVDIEMLRWYMTAAHTLVVFDNDEQGMNGGMAFQEKMPNVKLIHLPDGVHDVNDYHLAGGDLADWLCREVDRLGIVERSEDELV